MRPDVYVMGIAIAIAIVLLAIAAVVMVIYVIYYYVVRGILARTRTVPAEVLRKYQHEAGAGPHWDADEDASGGAFADYSPGYSFFVLFGVRGGQLEFCVPEDVYADVSEGETGFLVHKGTLFHSFVKDIRVSVTTGKVEIREVRGR